MEFGKKGGGSGPVNKCSEPDYPHDYQDNKYGNADFCQHNLSWWPGE
jgi:hypothetical protein